MKPMVNAKLTADRGRSENQAELLRTLSLPFSFSISLSLSGSPSPTAWPRGDGGRLDEWRRFARRLEGRARRRRNWRCLVGAGNGNGRSRRRLKKGGKKFPLCLSFPSVSFLSLFSSFLCLSSFALCPLLFSPKTPTRTDGMKWTDRVEPTATFNSRKESVFCWATKRKLKALVAAVAATATTTTATATTATTTAAAVTTTTTAAANHRSHKNRQIQEFSGGEERKNATEAED